MCEFWNCVALPWFTSHCLNSANSGSVHHFNLVSDPARHSYRECLVSVLWCWEIRECLHCPCMFLKPGKCISPADVDLSGDLQQLAARKKHQRGAAFKQLQGYSKQLSVLTNGRVDLSFFQLGQGYALRPVSQHERRVTERGVTEDEGFMVAWLLLVILLFAIIIINKS